MALTKILTFQRSGENEEAHRSTTRIMSYFCKVVGKKMAHSQTPSNHIVPTPSNHIVPFQSGGELGINVLMERMKRLTETDSSDMTSEELLQQFENVEIQSAESKFLFYVIILCFIKISFAPWSPTRVLPWIHTGAYCGSLDPGKSSVDFKFCCWQPCRYMYMCWWCSFISQIYLYFFPLTIVKMKDQ